MTSLLMQFPQTKRFLRTEDRRTTQSRATCGTCRHDISLHFQHYQNLSLMTSIPEIQPFIFLLVASLPRLIPHFGMTAVSGCSSHIPSLLSLPAEFKSSFLCDHLPWGLSQNAPVLGLPLHLALCLLANNT